MTDGWQPIDTAPKDGTIIWVAAPYSLCIAYWQGKDEKCWRNWYRGCRYDQHHLGVDNFLPPPIWFTPTHWQPVPSIRDLRREPSMQEDVGTPKTQAGQQRSGVQG